MTLQVSVIIPTFHRKEWVLRLMKSILNIQEKKIGEIIIVEQDDNNENEFKKYAKNHDLTVQYFFIRKRNFARAMNTGVTKARNDFVLFLDDDVTITKNLIESHVKNFNNSFVAATVGRVITDGQPIESERQDTGRINWLGMCSDGYSSTIKQQVDTTIGANMCWRRVIYQELGGVDEKFTGNALRLESDLSLRAKKKGYKIIFEPKALVYHHRAETGGARKSEGRIQWYVDFFSNETYFFLKHRIKLLLPIFLLTKWEWALRCMFGFGREVSVRSVTAPFRGIIDGMRKYNDYRR